jgi:hypothetical protein
MPGQLTDFLTSISTLGVAKTSHFVFNAGVVLPLGSPFAGVERVLQVRCEATELPGRQLVSEDSKVYGPTYKTPHGSVYQEITLTFVETSNFAIRTFFEFWMDLIWNSDSNLLEYPDKYRSDVSLTQYDVMLFGGLDKGKPPTAPPITANLRKIATWQLYKSFPTAINQMPVSWSEDGLHRTTVTLAFEWYALDSSSQKAPIGASTPAPLPVKASGGAGGLNGIISSIQSKFT